MKKILVSLVLIAFAFSLIAADELPPQLPSSFYGTVTGAPAGSVVTTNYGGIADVFRWNGLTVYHIDVTDGVEGQAVTFYVNGVKAGTGVYHTGTNANLNLVVAKGKPKPFHK